MRTRRGVVRAAHGGAWWAALALAAACVSSTGCRGAKEPASAASQTEQRYTVRGEVLKLPNPAHARPQLTLRHEAIPDFRDQAGAVVGMAAMVMPFEVAPSASLDGIAVGDKVEAVLAADWQRASFRLTAVKKLPPDTALVLEPTPAEKVPSPAR